VSRGLVGRPEVQAVTEEDAGSRGQEKGRVEEAYPATLEEKKWRWFVQRNKFFPEESAS